MAMEGMKAAPPVADADKAMANEIRVATERLNGLVTEAAATGLTVTFDTIEHEHFGRGHNATLLHVTVLKEI